MYVQTQNKQIVSALGTSNTSKNKQTNKNPNLKRGDKSCIQTVREVQKEKRNNVAQGCKQRHNRQQSGSVQFRLHCDQEYLKHSTST